MTTKIDSQEKFFYDLYTNQDYSEESSDCQTSHKCSATLITRWSPEEHFFIVLFPQEFAGQKFSKMS